MLRQTCTSQTLGRIQGLDIARTQSHFEYNQTDLERHWSFLLKQEPKKNNNNLNTYIQDICLLWIVKLINTQIFVIALLWSLVSQDKNWGGREPENLLLLPLGFDVQVHTQIQTALDWFVYVTDEAAHLFNVVYWQQNDQQGALTEEKAKVSTLGKL